MSSLRCGETSVPGFSMEWTRFWESESRPTALAERGSNGVCLACADFLAGARCGHRYFDALGISILLTLIESPFSSPVRLTV
jgi:hypothetical protein